MATVLRPAQRVAVSAARSVRQLHLSKPNNETFTVTDAVLPKPHSTKVAGKDRLGPLLCLQVLIGAL